MQTDQNLIFDGLNGVAHNIAGSANVPSTGTLDLSEGLMLTGANYDNPTINFKISPQLTVWGEDLGIGPLRLNMTAFVSSTLPFIGAGATLNIAYQGAIDNQSGVLAGLTWNTFGETGPSLTAANLLASALIPLPDFSRRAAAAAGRVDRRRQCRMVARLSRDGARGGRRSLRDRGDLGDLRGADDAQATSQRAVGDRAPDGGRRSAGARDRSTLDPNPELR